jgi:NAD(P)H-hydrate epimerase
METKLTEVMKLALPDYKGKCLGDGAAPRVLEAMADYDALALGPGLGTEEPTCRAVWEILERVDKAVILDADGINCAAQKPGCLAGRRYPTVLTPHPGELGRLLEKPTRYVQENRLASAMQAADAFGCVVVLKGANTLISNPGGKTYINPLALPSLATAGTGDVLTGCIAALAAQSLPALEAALCGVYLHGNAAVIASNIIGPAGMIAGDVVSHLPIALSGLLRHGEGGWMP